MSIEYELHLADERQPEVLVAAACLPGLPGLALKAGQPGAARCHSIRQAYGFTSRVCVDMRVDQSAYNADDGYAGNFSAIRAAMALLHASESDAVMLFNSEKPMFLRRGGRLVLNSEGGWWQSPAYLGLVDLPYGRQSLPSL